MPFKSWGAPVAFTQKRDINYTELVPAGKIIGLYGYQPAPATLTQANFSALQSFDLATIANSIQAAFQGTVNYIQLSWNETGGKTVSDLVMGVVFSNTTDVGGVQAILNAVYASPIGGILVATNMAQLNAWKAYRLNEASETNWIMIAGVAGGIIAVAAIAYLIRKRRQ